MQERIRAIVSQGKIEPLQELQVPDGTEVLITILPNDGDFWLSASGRSIDAVWDNPADDVYADLLEK